MHTRSTDRPAADAPYKNSAFPVGDRVEDLLGRMTIEEKVGQLNQRGFGSANDASMEVMTPLLRAGKVSSLINNLEGTVVRNQLQKIAREESRLGIPILFGFDVIHGLRTVFPITLGLSCSWEPALLERAQAMAARETRATGIDWVFAPMSDIARDPRWGRVAETCGEDPYLTSLCVAAQVRGFQGGNFAAPDRVAACLKHFVAYGAVTGGRDYNHTEVPESILRQTHLPPFRAGVNAGAATLMSAFNTIDGIPAAANRHTLTEILREEWGFDGFVISDWDAIAEIVPWGFAKDKAEAAWLAICAGNDMDMGSSSYSEGLPPQAAEGRLPMEILDDAVRRVLRVKFRLGLFDEKLPEETVYERAPLDPDDLALARECVARSAVLLKNTGMLPLSKEVKKIALIGPFGADQSEMLGTWSALGRPEDVVSLAQGLEAKITSATKLTVVKGCNSNTQARTKTLNDGSIVADEDPTVLADLELDKAVRAAEESDVVIMALGEPRGWSGENASRARLGLTGHQQMLFDAVAATGKPIVAILFCGRPLAIPTVVEKSAAVLVAWQPGIQAGNGLADLLFGDVAPSGRLTSSFPYDAGQSPLYYNRYKTGRPSTSMTEYRDITRNAQFWFGHGLTYTTFAYGRPRIVPASAGEPEKAVVTVTNTGKRDGHEVVQLYIRQLACHEAARPEQELRGFERIFLRPGEKAEVAFAFNDETLGYWGRNGKWHAESGDYHIWIAPCAQTGEPLLFSFSAHLA